MKLTRISRVFVRTRGCARGAGQLQIGNTAQFVDFLLCIPNGFDELFGTGTELIAPFSRCWHAPSL